MRPRAQTQLYTGKVSPVDLEASTWEHQRLDDSGKADDLGKAENSVETAPKCQCSSPIGESLGGGKGMAECGGYTALEFGIEGRFQLLFVPDCDENYPTNLHIEVSI